MSELPEKFGREFLEKLKYMVGEKKWLQLLEMAERGELDGYLQRFWGILERDELEQHLKRFEFKREFPGFSSRN